MKIIWKIFKKNTSIVFVLLYCLDLQWKHKLVISVLINRRDVAEMLSVSTPTLNTEQLINHKLLNMLFLPVLVEQKHCPREQVLVWPRAHLILFLQNVSRVHDRQNAAKETLCYRKKIASFTYIVFNKYYLIS